MGKSRQIPPTQSGNNGAEDKTESKEGVGRTEEHNASGIERHEFCFVSRKCIGNTENKQSKRTNERNKNNLVKSNLWHI